eukprot:CAMPEP_0119107128 /NCGR_PEP_ID=MMETSP1180-20130426/8098_1 /TAXON_ID=3052 ORGANISM="Chlamydomonas cf sp, Strain CCMP681" /NCGR_SAMPLE_ID=MMETSP1180 /ASSEMBLY_ACC=CAM_ASM_000741 /LENGTH=420 /DNA_ID=CAMNT_0007092569 /DNA_START=78 /DNA_END=1337 /DNA_ORIENTATION=+
MQKLRGTAAGRRPACSTVVRGLAFRPSMPPPVVNPVSSEEVQSPFLKTIQFINPIWSTVENEQQFFALLKGYLAKVPGGTEKLLPQWMDFYDNYRNAVVGSGLPGSNELLAAKVQSTIADTATLQFMKPYTFPSHHHRMLHDGERDYNYFEFGQRYTGSLLDWSSSVLGHRERWDHIASLLKQSHNVVLLANHQTEADPGVFAHMLMTTQPELATDVIYVAGDRVVTDPLSKPFSMGRNLFCVHSKKHLDDEPELKISKMETNRKTLVAMSRALNKGGCLMWIAPSGGRDRPKANDQYTPDPFDPAAVDLMRNLLTRAKQPGHLFPMAMYSWPMMPPPKTVDKVIGERRMTNFTPVGISLCEELDLKEILKGIPEQDKDGQQRELARVAQMAVIAEYQNIDAAIHDATKRGEGTAYTQPW